MYSPIVVVYVFQSLIAPVSMYDFKLLFVIVIGVASSVFGIATQLPKELIFTLNGFFCTKDFSSKVPAFLLFTSSTNT
jgi:hypothetical protein